MTMDDKKTMRELAQKLLEEMRKEEGKTIRKIESRAGIFKKSMGAGHRVGIGLSYRPARLHTL